MVTFIFTIDLRSGQKTSNFGSQNFLLKLYLFCSVLFLDSKKCHFCRTTTTNSKSRVSKNDVVTINQFLGYFTAKNKDIGLKLSTTIGNTWLYNIYSGLGGIYNILDFSGIYLSKSKFWFLGVKNPKFRKFDITVL